MSGCVVILLVRVDSVEVSLDEEVAFVAFLVVSFISVIQTTSKKKGKKIIKKNIDTCNGINCRKFLDKHATSSQVRS